MGGLPAGAVVDEPKSSLPPGAVIDEPEGKPEQVASDEVERGYSPYSWQDRFDPSAWYKAGSGLVDFVQMGVTAGVGEIVSGIAGGIALAMTGDPDHAANRTRAWQNAIMTGPVTDAGDSALNAVAPKLSEVAFKISDFAEEKADGDPAVAAAIETGIWGSVDIASAMVPGTKAVLSNAALRRMRKQVIAEANRLGIEIHLDDFRNTVADAAKLVGSESAGEMAEEYVTALRNAEYLAKLKKNSLYAAALKEDLFISTSPVRRMGAELSVQLHKMGFDLDAEDMAVVRRSLDDMHSRNLGFGSGQTLAVHFNQFELLRKRINRRIRSSDGSAEAALIQIRGRMDDFMTSEFNNAVIENGRVISSGGALSGDAGGFDAYLNARKAASEHAWFNDTKVIADLIKKETSVDQFAQWLIGASSVSKKGAAAVVNKMKLLLGEDHPAIAAVRADFIYQLTEPLLQLEPNFKQFANNYDKVLRKNKPLADALGLQESDVAALADYALVADRLPESGKFYSVREVVQTVARLGVGHGVAKGAARVTFATKVGNAMTFVDQVTPRQILMASVGARFDQPLVPKGTPVYAALVAGAALSGSADKDE